MRVAALSHPGPDGSETWGLARHSVQLRFGTSTYLTNNYYYNTTWTKSRGPDTSVFSNSNSESAQSGSSDENYQIPDTIGVPPDCFGTATGEDGSAAPDLQNLTPKIERDLLKRGWTPEDIQDAYENGEQVPAVNKANGEPATRYVNPTTGKSVVIENGSGQVIHVGGAGFKYGPESGDLP
jgi:hypothetical protein